MATTTELIPYAIGGGLGQATIFFPITYFAMRKQFNLRKDLGQAWRPFIISIVIFALLKVLGFEPSSDTPAGLTMFFLVPIFVCAVVLNFTYRESTAISDE